MRCPYCLDASGQFIRDSRTNLSHCQACRSNIPKAYLETATTNQVTTGVVGFAGHGKTVFLTSLFSVLKHASKYWASYYYRSLDDYTHRIIYEQVPRFEAGELPDSTPVNFPNPALVHYHELPVFGEAFVAYYDTAGEVFHQAEHIAKSGFFVAHSDVVLFIISIPDCPKDNLDDEMSRLLDTYIRACEDRLNSPNKKGQRLVVIFTKADLLADKLPTRLEDWLKEGVASWYGMNLMSRTLEIAEASLWIEEWVREDIQCSRFVNMAHAHFKEVRFSIVSALGIEGMPLDADEPRPLRVMDPFIWLMMYAKGSTAQKNGVKMGFLDRLMRWISGEKEAAGPKK